ncbi:MAG: SIR2 family protein [Saprospiraceae bacterium]|nr:SIR2 family protein [Saprospiraceae bacterium]
MKKIDYKELKEIIQSGHINLLLGSGCSLEYLTTLTDIESRMNVEGTREDAQKDYYKIIKKSLAIIDEFRESDATELAKLKKTKENYDNFLSMWATTISNRSLHIVNKQVNIFTTNFDMFIEDSCERLGIPYNDGFSGRINSLFNISNFNKIQKYKSLQFDNTSDIPLINIIKLHGSVSWQMQDDKILYSKGSHIPRNLEALTRERFSRGYKRIAIINPNSNKLIETVLDVNYASLLRKFTLELEKENSVLFIIGCSLNDKHINALLYSVLKSNPTLIVIFISNSPYDTSSDRYDEKKHPNLYIVCPDICRARFEKYFGVGMESDWQDFVRDINANNWELTDSYKNKIHQLSEENQTLIEKKNKIKKVIYFSFDQTSEFIENIFTRNEKTNYHGS